MKHQDLSRAKTFLKISTSFFRPDMEQNEQYLANLSIFIPSPEFPFLTPIISAW